MAIKDCPSGSGGQGVKECDEIKRLPLNESYGCCQLIINGHFLLAQKEKNTVNLMPTKPKHLLSKISKVDIKGTTIIL